MDQFVVQAQHSGSISLAHSFLFPAHAVQLAKEVRLAVTIVAVAWVTVSALGAWRNSHGVVFVASRRLWGNSETNITGVEARQLQLSHTERSKDLMNHGVMEQSLLED
ncbi:hypothetical protein E4U61_002913 [Claviceps capensis]|nr:hypothetical protein E4U61_002913 [Claviceps capensis]